MKIEYVYGKSKCGKCGKENTLDNMIWSDSKMAHVCKTCSDIAKVAK